MDKKLHSYNALGLKCNVVSFGEILKEICPTASLSSEVEEGLSSMVNNFIQDAVKESCKLAEHRGSDSVDPEDIALFLKTQCNLDPTLISDEYYYVQSCIEKTSSARAPRKSRRIVEQLETVPDNSPEDPYLHKINKFKEKVVRHS